MLIEFEKKRETTAVQYNSLKVSVKSTVSLDDCSLYLSLDSLGYDIHVDLKKAKK